MNIKKEVKDKIFDYILDKYLDESLKELPSKGKYEVESCYELAYNKKIDNIIFVISLMITYNNYSIDKKSYGLYAFDVNSGDIIKNYKENGMCYDGFFQHLEVIEEII